MISSQLTWVPSATPDALRQRARFMAKIRNFFAERDVLEVDTPVLSHATITDPYVVGIPAIFKPLGESVEETLYLQTSPEYAMKRLLAFGMGSIYQINKAFRQGEVGKIHNPEFTILEWYRPGFDHHTLMDEMDLFLQYVIDTLPAERISYGALFKSHLDLDPHTATLEELISCATDKNIILKETLPNRDVWLDVLWTHCIEPCVGQDRPIFLFDFPASQAALAKIRAHENPPVASRFEVYFKGVELANGFHELQDASEQVLRFTNDLTYRKEIGLSAVSVDQRFIAALEHGLPDCAGVALGVDRLVMLGLNYKSVSDVISFSFEKA